MLCPLSRLLMLAAALTLSLLTGLPNIGLAEPKSNDGWTELITEDFSAWRGSPKKSWIVGGGAELRPDNPRKLKALPGEGIIVNGVKGRVRDLLTKNTYGDAQVRLEFLVSRGSNSGIKLHGHYEIQIKDSHGKKVADAKDCGGIYPRAKMRPRYTHIDKGIPPMCNAAKPAGEWQTLDITFRAPRFDKQGKKVANAKLVKVLLNGKVIHENQELKTPTGALWVRPEMAEGPIRLQADHGPVAFRSCKIRSLK